MRNHHAFAAGGVSKLAFAQIYADMSHIFRQQKENQISGLKLTFWYLNASSYLMFCTARQSDVEKCFINYHHKTGAICPLSARTAPLVRSSFPFSDLGPNVFLNIFREMRMINGFQRVRRGGAACCDKQKKHRCSP